MWSRNAALFRVGVEELLVQHAHAQGSRAGGSCGHRQRQYGMMATQSKERISSSSSFRGRSDKRSPYDCHCLPRPSRNSTPASPCPMSARQLRGHGHSADRCRGWEVTSVALLLPRLCPLPTIDIKWRNLETCRCASKHPPKHLPSATRPATHRHIPSISSLRTTLLLRNPPITPRHANDPCHPADPGPVTSAPFSPPRRTCCPSTSRLLRDTGSSSSVT